MISHRRGGGLLREQHQSTSSSIGNASSRFLTVAASAASAGIGAAAASISSTISNGSNHGHGNNHSHNHNHNGNNNGGHQHQHQASKAIGVSPLIDCNNNGCNSGNGNGCNSGNNNNSGNGGGGILSNMMTTQTIQNGFSRRKRSSPLLTEDRLMSLLLLIVAVWFLYVRYEETKAFEDSGNAALLDKKGRPVAHYTPSEEYLAALNMEKKRDYDAHLQAAAAAHNKQGGAETDSSNSVFNNVRLYPDMGDDDSLIEQGFSSQYSHLRGNSLAGDDETTMRDTDLYTPSEIRLKMVSHGGLDKGGGYSTAAGNTADSKIRYYGTSYNKKVQYRNGTGTKTGGTVPKRASGASKYPPAASFPEFENDDKTTTSTTTKKTAATQNYRPARVPTTTYQKKTATTSTYSGSAGATTTTGKTTGTGTVPMTHHPATKAKPVVHHDFDVDGYGNRGSTTTTTTTTTTTAKKAPYTSTTTYPKAKQFTKPTSTTATGTGTGTTTGTGYSTYKKTAAAKKTNTGSYPSSSYTTTTKKKAAAPVYVPKPVDPTKKRRDMVYPADFYAREDFEQNYVTTTNKNSKKHPYMPKRASTVTATTSTTTARTTKTVSRGNQDPFLVSTPDDDDDY